ncbi:MAG: hypothetical protein J6P54_09790 [Bacteroidales bacterium]|nr:hypothetical protein [Bacteroidales bacterium]
MPLRKEVVMSSKKAPINDLQEIAKRKQQLRAKIEVQERKLSKDLDAYQDDVETLKKTWNGLKNIRNFGQNFSLSGISNAVQTVRALPIGKAAKKTGKPGWLAAFTIGAEVVNWIVQRRKRKKENSK